MSTDLNKSNETTLETREWQESLEEVLEREGAERACQLLSELSTFIHERGVRIPFTANTPYINTIPADKQAPYPGSKEIEYRIASVIRWNAMAMVVRANREEKGIGGHISTYASASTLYEVAFNHFIRGKTEDHSGDLVYYQGHASPGIYARAFLEGRFPIEQVNNFRHELHDSPGLSSYPHPWLMPNFWKFPTVSMGLGPIQAIYHAKFIKYLEDRNLKPKTDQRLWSFLGDGETDEPEALGALTLASREKLDNLIFVVNCNLQRLDGPVRGNGKIIQELEASFRGAGWYVIKVVWGSGWDSLLEKDSEGLLVKRMNETVDGHWQKYVVEDGEFFRKDFFGKDPRLLEMVKHLSNEELKELSNMGRGGHDPGKVYAAYKTAVEYKKGPTVVLCQTIKGYGLGRGGEGMNMTHNQKILNEEQLLEFRTRFGIPLSDDEVKKLPFYRFSEGSEEYEYLIERRKKLGGFNPVREGMRNKLSLPETATFAEFFESSGEREVSTTMAYVRMLSKMLEDPNIGKYIVPIIPDEGRTFGMESLFRQCGIYSHPGQLYEPVDIENLLYYKETTDGQIIEEGITEAGSLSTFIAAGTAYSNHNINMIPFFTFYSMFGFQRVGDLIWAAADSCCKGFLVGATSGRTTLAGEGLQHQDGNSQLLAYPVPNLVSYDPAYAYEIAIIIQDGIRRMYSENENIFYYLTVVNENYHQPAMPEGVEKGILKGIYKFRNSEKTATTARVQLFGSGAILNEAIKAAGILEEKYQLAADVWSATSYKMLHNDALDIERLNRLHPEDKPQQPYIVEVLKDVKGPFIAACDYVKAVPLTIANWIPGKFTVLGTDGFGRSDGRESLRDFFEVSAAHIVIAALYAAVEDGQIGKEIVAKAIKELNINPDKSNPLLS
ncbi:MAG: pyruvate dehydrogenase (acetyl-transferring), homodimeric type [Victivallaceae bacterium]